MPTLQKEIEIKDKYIEKLENRNSGLLVIVFGLILLLCLVSVVAILVWP